MNMDGNGESSTATVSTMVTDSTSTLPKTEDTGSSSVPSGDQKLCSVDECPPWSICAFLAFQVASLTKPTLQLQKYTSMRRRRGIPP